MPWHNASRPNKLLFWSLIVLGVVLVLAVALALRGFNRDISRESVSGTPVGTPNSNSSQSSLRSEKSAVQNPVKGMSMLSGFVFEVRTDDSGAKWIKLSVTTSEPPTADQLPDKRDGMTAVASEAKTTAYRFYLKKDTEGANNIAGGEMATVSFQGNPSEQDFMLASSISSIKQ